MTQYVNHVYVSTNSTKTEVTMNFSQLFPNESNETQPQPVTNIVMTGEMANKLKDLLCHLLDGTTADGLE